MGDAILQKYPYVETLDFKQMFQDLTKSQWKDYTPLEISQMMKQLSDKIETLATTIHKTPNEIWYKSMCIPEMKRAEDKILRIKWMKPSQLSVTQHAFITINLDDTKFETSDYPKRMLGIKDVLFETAMFRNNKIWVVLEKNRSDGIHHHIHLLIETTEKHTPAWYAQKIFAFKTVRQCLKSENYVDVKLSWARDPEKRASPFNVLLDYVHGKKKTEKMEYVEKDDTWRNENEIEKIYHREI